MMVSNIGAFVAGQGRPLGVPAQHRHRGNEGRLFWHPLERPPASPVPASKDITWSCDFDAPANRLELINSSKIVCHQIAEGWEWMDEDGAVLSRVPDQLAYEACALHLASSSVACSATPTGPSRISLESVGLSRMLNVTGGRRTSPVLRPSAVLHERMTPDGSHCHSRPGFPRLLGNRRVVTGQVTFDSVRTRPAANRCRCRRSVSCCAARTCRSRTSPPPRRPRRSLRGTSPRRRRCCSPSTATTTTPADGNVHPGAEHHGPVGHGRPVRSNRLVSP
jgi:hypothetical protein